MNPQSPNFFSSRNYTPAPRDFSSSSNVQGGGGSFNQRLKNLSKSTKILIIVAITAVFLITLFATIGGINQQRRDEQQKYEDTQETIVELIQNIKFNYETLLFLYGKYIGFTPQLSYTEEHFFPSGNYAEIKKMIDAISSDIAELSQYSPGNTKAKKRYEELIDNLQTNISSLSGNINTMALFYVAFYQPTFEEEDSSKSCVVTDEIKTLLSSSNEHIVSSATKYEKLSCEYISVLDKSDETDDGKDFFYVNNQDMIRSAIDDLNKALEHINEDNLNINNWNVFSENNREES